MDIKRHRPRKLAKATNAGRRIERHKDCGYALPYITRATYGEPEDNAHPHVSGTIAVARHYRNQELSRINQGGISLLPQPH